MKGQIKDRFAAKARELKWRYVGRQHRRFPGKRPELYALLGQVRLRLITLIQAKADFDNHESNHKALALQYSIALAQTINKVRQRGDEVIEIFLDDGLSLVYKQVMADYFQQESLLDEDHPLHFVESKQFHLIQLADIFAGFVRECLTEFDQGVLPSCQRCRFPGHHKSDCSFYTGRRKIKGFGRFKHIHNLYLNNQHGWVTLHGFLIWPFEKQSKYLFLDCLAGARE